MDEARCPTLAAARQHQISTIRVSESTAKPLRCLRSVQGSAGCRQKIVPTRAVVPGEDFASAFADLEAIEPVASSPSVVLDPRREFWLSYQVRQGSSAQKRRAVSARLWSSSVGQRGA